MGKTEEFLKKLLDEYPRELILAGLNEISRINKEGLSRSGKLCEVKISKKKTKIKTKQISQK